MNLTQQYSSAFHDMDSPIGVYKICFPAKSNAEIEKNVNKYKRKLYSRYINGDTFNMSTEQMLTQAIKNSLYSSIELDIMVNYNIEQDFREEIADMYTISMELINCTSIENIHMLIKDFELVEDAFGKRISKNPEQLTDKTLYNNKLVSYK